MGDSTLTRIAGNRPVRRQSSLQYSHGDEGFWDKLNKLQKKYLPALSSIMENIEHMITENGVSEQIQEIRAKLGRLNSMLLNIYGIHKFHKKMEILENIETQVKRWITAWEMCTQDTLLQHKSQTSINTTIHKPKRNLSATTPSAPSSLRNRLEIEDESSGDSCSSEESEEDSEDNEPVQVTKLGFTQLQDLMKTFEQCNLGKETREVTCSGNKRTRDLPSDRMQRRMLGKSLPVFEEEEEEEEYPHGKKRMISLNSPYRL